MTNTILLYLAVLLKRRVVSNYLISKCNIVLSTVARPTLSANRTFQRKNPFEQTQTWTRSERSQQQGSIQVDQCVPAHLNSSRLHLHPPRFNDRNENQRRVLSRADIIDLSLVWQLEREATRSNTRPDNKKQRRARTQRTEERAREKHADEFIRVGQTRAFQQQREPLNRLQTTFWRSAGRGTADDRCTKGTMHPVQFAETSRDLSVRKKRIKPRDKWNPTTITRRGGSRELVVLRCVSIGFAMFHPVSRQDTTHAREGASRRQMRHYASTDKEKKRNSACKLTLLLRFSRSVVVTSVFLSASSVHARSTSTLSFLALVGHGCACFLLFFFRVIRPRAGFGFLRIRIWERRCENTRSVHGK